MYSVKVKETDIPILNESRYNHPVRTVQKRMQVIYLLGIGIKDYGIIALIADIHRDTVTDYIKLYNSKGIDGLRELNIVGRTSELNPYKSTLEEYFRENPVHTVSEAKEKIKELTGIEKQTGQIRIFLKGLRNEIPQDVFHSC